MASLLSIRGLTVDYRATPMPAHVVRGIDLDVGPGESVGLVGESGCGKSTSLLAVLGLLPSGRATVGGSIKFGDAELVGAGEQRLGRLRGPQIGAVFQNARAALHPMRTIGDQVARPVRRHRKLGAREARAQAISALAEAGLPDPEVIARRFPHQLSGGQCQRALIAAALVLRPRLILADEPTSGLDVTVQEQVLETLSQMVGETSTALLLVSHDLHVIARTCQRIAVMYAGEIVEEGRSADVLRDPKHPYTQGLLASLQVSDGRLGSIAGSVRDPRLVVEGCSFANRCPHVHERCLAQRPVLRRPAGEERLVRCVLYGGDVSDQSMTTRVGARC